MRPVTIERIEGETAIVAKGVTAGDQVVSEGQNQLRPGARVSTRPAGGGRQP
jgi:multidrug efflux system membrane fusion protein